MNQNSDEEAKTVTSGLPAEIENALRRYIEIQKEAAALQEEKYRLRDLIGDYMKQKNAAMISPEVDGERLSVRNTVKTVVDYNEVLLKERLGSNYKLILWPDPAKIKKNLSHVAPLLMSIIEEVGSPSQDAVKAAIANGKIDKNVFSGAFEKRQTHLFSVSAYHDRGQTVGEEAAGYDEDPAS